MAFFRKALSDSLQESAVSGGVSAAPFIAPAMLTINDFFYKVYDVDTTDRIRLLVELYACYREVFPEAEPLDEFIFWGDVILSDFDDIDKYLADPEHLFANVSDFKAIQDSYSYLTENQKNAVDRFLSHFRDGSGRLTVNMDTDGNVKVRFLRIWNVLYPLYCRFNAHLKERSMAYEGMVYRDLATRLKDIPVRDLLEPVFPGKEKFVFVGLNALNECEKVLMRKMRDAGVAEFCWDYVSEMIRDTRNKSSVFMKDNVLEFPNAFRVDPDGLGKPAFHVVSVPSSVGQTKLAPAILARCNTENPVETAFILPDENLLMPLLNSIPPQYDSINVTMGCPLTGGAVYSLVTAVAAMQQRLREKAGQWFFYHREIRSIFSNSLFRAVLTEEEETVVRRVKADAKYYVPEKELQGGSLLDLVFRPVITRPKEASAEQNRQLVRYLTDIVSYVGWKLRGVEDMLLELDFAKRCMQSLNLVGGIDLDVLPATWLHLLDELLSGEAVPFRGEPLEGLQVMGPLETRALDFRNIVLFSTNEGVFPRRGSSASFVPPELRKGFGLPTFEYQDSVWAYYFYRMIQRAEHVWLVCDSRTEGLKTGEESRYIKQLQYYYHAPLERFVATARMQLAPQADEIRKTPEDIEAIRNGELSASSLQYYLSCPARFYYSFIRRLQDEDEVLEAMDAGSLGRVYHKTMEALYKPYRDRLLTVADLERMAGDRKALKALVRERIIEEMKTVDVTGRDLVVEEVIVEYALRTLKYDRDLLVDSGSKGFEILQMEKLMKCDFEGFHLKGYADRIDSYLGGEARIVDYKTGKVEQEDIDIDDGNAEAVVEKLFGPTNAGRPKIALQLFIYGLLVKEVDNLRDRPVVNSIYSVSRLFTDPLEDRPANAEFARLTRERLKDLLAEMTDPSVPFRRTEELKTCAYCDFKMICGR